MGPGVPELQVQGQEGDIDNTVDESVSFSSHIQPCLVHATHPAPVTLGKMVSWLVLCQLNTS